MTDKVELTVPDIGDFDAVEVIDVMVAAGDEVAVEDPLITLETDKAAMDVPSTHAGKITELKVKTGDKVSKGDVIALLEAGEESRREGAAPTDADSEETAPTESRREGAAPTDADSEDAAPTESRREGAAPTDADSEDAAPTESRREGATPTDDSGRDQADSDDAGDAGRGSGAFAPRSSQDGKPPHASPSVRKFARELGVDLARVTGSGRKGRITHDDVKAHVKGVMQGGGEGGGGFSLPAMPTVDFSKWGEVETKPLSRIKRISGPHLQRAWITVPHVTQHDEADITELEVVRKALKSDAEKSGAKLTPLAFIAKACVHALKEFPDFNASLDASGENLVLKRYYHIGFAVDTEEGLVVPVLRDVDSMSVFDIAKALGEVSERARNRKLKAEDMQGGTFSISSLGGIGGTAFTPIVNAPEVAILGVSRAYMKPVWDDGEFEGRLMLPLSLSYDHRVIDGAAAARFTTYLSEVLAEVRNLVL